MRALVYALALAGCALPVHAVGHLQRDGDRILIASTSGNQRQLILEGDARLLRMGEGLLVEVDGVLKQGDVRVDAWRILQGPLGLEPYVGRVATSGGGLHLLLADGSRIALDGPGVSGLREQIGMIVLVEGAIDGPMRLQVLGHRVLGAAR